MQRRLPDTNKKNLGVEGGLCLCLRVNGVSGRDPLPLPLFEGGGGPLRGVGRGPMSLGGGVSGRGPLPLSLGGEGLRLGG